MPKRYKHPEIRRNSGLDAVRVETSHRILRRTGHQGRGQLSALPPVGFPITLTYTALETRTLHTRKRRVSACKALASIALVSSLETVSNALRTRRTGMWRCYKAGTIRRGYSPLSKSIKDGWGTAVFAILLPSSPLLSSRAPPLPSRFRRRSMRRAVPLCHRPPSSATHALAFGDLNAFTDEHSIAVSRFTVLIQSSC